RQSAAVEEGHDAEIAAELLEPDASLDRELGEAAAADRVAVEVLGPELLIAVAPHRAAPAGIKPARRRDVEQARAEDCPEPNPSGGNDAIRDGMVGAGVDLRPAVAEVAAVEGDFRAETAAQAESARRVQQAVAAVKAERQWQCGDQEAACVLDPRAAEHATLDRSEPLAAVGPGPGLLPDEVALPLDIGGKVDGLGGVGGEPLVRRRELHIERLVAHQEVGAADLDAEQLLGGTGDA